MSDLFKNTLTEIILNQFFLRNLRALQVSFMLKLSINLF